jgi:hypothetical protein
LEPEQRQEFEDAKEEAINAAKLDLQQKEKEVMVFVKVEI